MKKFVITLLLLLCCTASALADILPATGVDEEFKAWTGLECTPSVVLCESLSILDNRGDQGGKKVGTLLYGNTPPVIESWDGYAKIYYADGSKTGWVRNEYLMMDPAWYVCDDSTQVYAYPDVMAPKIALLDKDTKLPILTEYQDDTINGWVCVSLRGAAGWIRKTPKDTQSSTFFRPESLNSITKAQLCLENYSPITCTDASLLAELSPLLTNAEDKGGPVAGCPFTATLKLWLNDGTQTELLLATDSCCTYRVDNRDYSYARHLWNEEEGSPTNDVLFGFFNIDIQAFYNRK